MIQIRRLSVPVTKQRHINILLRYIVLMLFAMSAFQLQVGVNGAFSRSAELLAKDGVSYDYFWE